MKKILITGMNGQVGSELNDLAQNYPDFEFKFTDRSTLDIGDKENVLKILEEFAPNFIINTAAYTAVDKAEEEQEISEKINATALEYLAEACKKNDAWLMHISSDYVYHIDKDEPLIESDETKPQGIYAKTKLAGEKILEASEINYCILRTSWVYSFFGNNFVKTMIRLGNQRDELSIVADQIGAPTYAKDIADTLLKMIVKICGSEKKESLVGTYNYANGGVTNWADFARTIFEMKHIECVVNETTTEAYGAPAPRPKWSVLDKTLIHDTFGIEIMDWKESLKACIERIETNMTSKV